MFRLDTTNDLKRIMEITKKVVTRMHNLDNFIQWDETYPNISVFTKDIKSKSLYVYLDEEIEAYICINKEIYEQYHNLKWSSDTNEFYVIHRIAANPDYQKGNLGSKLMTFAENHTKANRLNYLKIDTNSQNMRMIKLIEKFDYNFIGTMDLKPPLPLWNCYDKLL